MAAEFFISDIVLSRSIPEIGISTITPVGVLFSIISLALILLLIKKKFSIYNSAIVKHSGVHTSIKEMNFKDQVAKEEDIEGPELLFYKASHDLKGPLKSIRGLVQLALKDQNKENHGQYLEKINETTTSLEEFLEEILNLGRIKKQRTRKKEIDLKDFLAGIIAGFENYPGRNNLEIKLKINPEIRIISDDSLLKSIFQNLIENAIKYSDEKKAFSELTITGKIESGHLSLSFVDNGLGISSDNLPYVFDLFYRVDSIKEGSGLGLYIVKEALKKLNGKIKALSRIGIGSEFIVEVPLAETEENISAEKSSLEAKN